MGIEILSDNIKGIDLIPVNVDVYDINNNKISQTVFAPMRCRCNEFEKEYLCNFTNPE